jgi:hypothetical protein
VYGLAKLRLRDCVAEPQFICDGCRVRFRRFPRPAEAKCQQWVRVMRDETLLAARHVEPVAEYRRGRFASANIVSMLNS